ncbi:MAG TPA: hypothetical protein PKY56_09550 [Candidatus Kapabacteria bacterium]|nr:hypothetical protein [Candidatus Kapabacteria bacterium]HPO63053.1 hypothetical protein [Candidatus Kapabacteria bacterium]
MNTRENKLTNFELELIKLLRYNLTEFELLELKNILSKFISEKIDKEMDKIWNEKAWSNKKIDEIANLHLRTDY